MRKPVHSLIIPVYKNEENIPALLVALGNLNQKIENFEVVFVVDGSPDHSYAMLLEQLSSQPYMSQLILLSRNFGSFAAIRRGLEVARGELFAVMAADLQEPPELIVEFFALLAEGQHDVAVGVRAKRDDPSLTKLLSKLFWTFYRRLVISDVPDGGVDVFACNDKVRSSLLMLEESNSSLIGQLFWVGFRRGFVKYERQKRELGQSAWNFSRKLRYMLDSVFAFSDLPILMFLWVGGFGIVISFLVSLVVTISWMLSLITVPGYAPIILSIYFIGSLLILGQGIIGSYVWRCNENTKKRPITLLQEKHQFDGHEG
ncbi:MAG: glycosyltransferase family 2 protein [Mariprofundus sp.]|nr:glycosyltransferase family 2 protein [Mariprofundus sp.]